MNCLEVGIDCRIDNFRQGIGTAILSLAHALCDLPVRNERYTFILFEDHRELFEKLPEDRASLLIAARPAASAVKSSLRQLGLLKAIWRPARAAVGPLPVSDGLAEERHFDVLHFPTQVGYLTTVPSIYQPWDLQHVHLPQFFSMHERIWRNRLYKAMCRQARFVSVQTEWGKNDLMRQYGIEAEKIAVIPWGSVLNAYPRPEPQDIDATRVKYGLPAQFLYYPAITWPHKNHELAIRALAELTRQGINMSLVCTGDRTDYSAQLEQLAERSGVRNQLKILGFVSPVELQSIYSLATAMIFPSRFEGFGLPVLEAFQSGLPVLCARATVLPEVAGDAALFFDPDDPKEAAAEIRKLMASSDLREDMVQKGTARASTLTVTKAAVQFRELYQRIAAADGQRKTKPQLREAEGEGH